MVCVVGHAGTGRQNSWDTTHGSREVKQGTEKVKMCKIYTGIVCSDHVEVFKDRTPPLFKNQTFAMPHHVYCSPAGEELFRNAGAKTAADLTTDFATALAKVGGLHVSKDEYEGAKKVVAHGANFVKKDEIKKAIEVFTKLTQHANELLRPLGTKELDALEASGSARVDAARETLQSSEEQGKKELKKVADEYAPLPCSKKAAEILKLMAEKGR
jgi:hypothetical protein